MNNITEKVREMMLRWYGHMQMMEEHNEVRAVVDMIVPGKRPRVRQRGRPRGRWMDCVRRDMQEKPGTADHPGGCPGQNILEIKNSSR